MSICEPPCRYLRSGPLLATTVIYGVMTVCLAVFESEKAWILPQGVWCLNQKQTKSFGLMWHVDCQLEFSAGLATSSLLEKLNTFRLPVSARNFLRNAEEAQYVCASHCSYIELLSHNHRHDHCYQEVSRWT